ncbi:MAG: HEAT repeat domain-containing protein [Desulfobulbaceae bacterium]|nr:MAG: HEAT repeat domain-containing protein [Desulfobulbaceae bacterium]
MMNRVQFKKHVINLLRGEDLDTIFDELSSLPPKNLINSLFTCLCHSHELVRWHAVSSFGLVVPAMAASDMEKARTVMRRFLWMLNDESGGIGWGVPEAMAEVMFHSRPLAEEYLHMLVSYTLDDGPELFQDGNFLELELLQEGVLWGLCRVAPRYVTELTKLGLDENIAVYLLSENNTVKGLACRLANLLDLQKYKPVLESAQDNHKPVRIYQQGAFINSTVAELAETATQSL